MKSINEELDVLFMEWENESVKNFLTGFCRDGVMNKGLIFSEIGSDGKLYWKRNSGNEDKMWRQSEKKILFLTKDTFDNAGDDMRKWIGRQHPTLISHKFFKNIALWLFGIYTMEKNGNYNPFEIADNPVKFSEAFDNFPVAIVNVKKESGYSRVSDETLLAYTKVYGNFLKRQIQILNPNIIVCCGGIKVRVILKIVMEIVYPEINFTKINPWIYFNKDHNITLIDSYHPSAQISNKEKYDGIMNNLKEHIIKQ